MRVRQDLGELTAGFGSTLKLQLSNFTSLRQPTLQGVEAVEALLSATPETPSYMIGVSENKITRIPLLEAVAKVRE